MITKSIYKKIGVFCAVCGLLTSCAEDTTEPVLQLRQAATLNAVSPADITITKDNSKAQFPEITWEKANYGNGAVVNYEVTLTNNINQKSVVIGETGDTKLSFTNAEMNKILASIGAYPGQAYDFTVSLKSTAFDVYQNEATNTVAFKATPYDPNVDDIDWPYAYVAVGYPNWDYTTAYLIGDPDGDGVYQGWVQFDDATTYAILDGNDVTKVLAQGEVTDDDALLVTVVSQRHFIVDHCPIAIVGFLPSNLRELCRAVILSDGDVGRADSIQRSRLSQLQHRVGGVLGTSDQTADSTEDTYFLIYAFGNHNF